MYYVYYSSHDVKVYSGLAIDFWGLGGFVSLDTMSSLYVRSDLPIMDQLSPSCDPCQTPLILISRLELW